MNYNNPLDYLLTENIISRSPLFTTDHTNEITLPEDDDILGPSEEMETPGDEALEHSTEPRDIISELQRKISDLKEDITEKLKSIYPEDKDKDIAEALDDATSALDLASHHLTDVDNSLSGSTDKEEPIGGESDGQELTLTDTATEPLDGGE